MGIRGNKMNYNPSSDWPHQQALEDTCKKQKIYIKKFYAKHSGHNIDEFECQGSTVVMCLNEECDKDYIMVN